MTKKLISFHSISRMEQYILGVCNKAEFDGLDESGQKVFDTNKVKPVRKYISTIKTHGTCASVVYDPSTDDIYAQSKGAVLSLQKDNAGFANFVDKTQSVFKELLTNIKTELDIKDSFVTVYGEWIGKGIQKGCAIHKIDGKKFIAFGVKVSPFDNETDSYWLSFDVVKTFENVEAAVFNVFMFKSDKFTLDFNDVESITEKLTKEMLLVEEECPVGKYFGQEGVGEGLVLYSVDDPGDCFKIKGEKHASKGRNREPLTPEELARRELNEVVAAEVTPDWRLDQGLTETFDLLNGGTLDKKKIGIYIKWIMGDIIKEDMHVLHKNDLTIKDISSAVSRRAVHFFNSEIELQKIV